MLRKTQRGFAVLESILIAVIVILIAFVAWYAFHIKTSTDNTLNAAGNQQISPPKKAAATPAKTVSNSVVTTKTDPSLGEYLADVNGMALYTYGQDSMDTSSCTTSCLAVWPAYKAASAGASLPANVGTITRPDGTLQYTYKKLPLYHYTGDTSAGQVTGDHVNGFSVAKP